MFNITLLLRWIIAKIVDKEKYNNGKILIMDSRKRWMCMLTCNEMLNMPIVTVINSHFCVYIIVTLFIATKIKAFRI